jgi:hypothetical protein
LGLFYHWRLGGGSLCAYGYFLSFPFHVFNPSLPCSPPPPPFISLSFR